MSKKWAIFLLIVISFRDIYGLSPNLEMLLNCWEKIKEGIFFCPVRWDENNSINQIKTTHRSMRYTLKVKFDCTIFHYRRTPTQHLFTNLKMTHSLTVGRQFCECVLHVKIKYVASRVHDLNCISLSVVLKSFKDKPRSLRTYRVAITQSQVIKVNENIKFLIKLIFIIYLKSC